MHRRPARVAGTIAGSLVVTPVRPVGAAAIGTSSAVVVEVDSPAILTVEAGSLVATVVDSPGWLAGQPVGRHWRLVGRLAPLVRGIVVVGRAVGGRAIGLPATVRTGLLLAVGSVVVPLALID